MDEPAEPMAIQTVPGHVDDPPQAALLGFLKDHDQPCPACKYNLRNLTGNICPECGNAVQLGITLVDPYLRAWVALIIALLPPASFGALYIGIFLYIAARQGRLFLHLRDLRGVPISLLIVMSHLAVSVPLAIIAIAARRRFMRLPRPRQKLLAGLAWSAWGVSFFCILILMNS